MSDKLKLGSQGVEWKPDVLSGTPVQLPGQSVKGIMPKTLTSEEVIKSLSTPSNRMLSDAIEDFISRLKEFQKTANFKLVNLHIVTSTNKLTEVRATLGLGATFPAYHEIANAYVQSMVANIGLDVKKCLFQVAVDIPKTKPDSESQDAC